MPTLNGRKVDHQECHLDRKLRLLSINIPCRLLLRRITTKNRNCMGAVSTNNLNWLDVKAYMFYFYHVCLVRVATERRAKTNKGMNDKMCHAKHILDMYKSLYSSAPTKKKTPGDNWVSSSVLHCLFKRPTLKVYQTLRQLATHVLHTHIAQSISQVFSPQPLSGKIPGF